MRSRLPGGRSRRGAWRSSRRSRSISVDGLDEPSAPRGATASTAGLERPEGEGDAALQLRDRGRGAGEHQDHRDPDEDGEDDRAAPGDARSAVPVAGEPAGHHGSLPERPRVGVRDEHPLHPVQLLEDDPGAPRDAGQRIVGDVDRHLGRLGDAPVEAQEEGAAAGEDDPLVHDVGDELGRGLLDRVLDRVHDLLDGRLDRLPDLVGADLDAARQAGEEVAAAEVDALGVPVARVARPDRDLDVLGSPLPEEQVVLAAGEGDDVHVHLVAADPDAPAHDDAAEADHRDLGRPAADVDDEAAGRLADGEAGPDRGRHRLLDQAGPAGAGVERRVADRALLHLGHAGRDPQHHPRPRDEPDPVVDPVDEVLDHLLGDVEVADDAVAQGADRDDVRRRAADHPLRLGADRQDLLRLGVDRDDAGLADDDPAVADVDERVRRPEVDPDVAGEDAEDRVEHGAGLGSCAGRSAGRPRRTPRRLGGARRRVRPVGPPGEYTPAIRVALGTGQAGPSGRRSLRRGRRTPQPGTAAVERDAPVAQRDERVVAR